MEFDEKLKNEIKESQQSRKEHSKEINKICDESLQYLAGIREKYDDSFDPQQRSIILYYLNSVMIAHDIALLQLQEYNQNSSVMIAARSVFEGCATCLQLMREYKEDEVSEFYKYLVAMDINQDLKIYNGWNELNLDYLNRFHNKISKYFPEHLKNIISKYDGRKEDYPKQEISKLKDMVEHVWKKYRYKYSKTKLCKELFSANNLFEDKPTADVPVIYPMNCHFSHLNLTAIDDMCTVNIKNKSYISFNNNHKQLLPTIQWVRYSLKYLFEEVKSFINKPSP